LPVGGLVGRDGFVFRLDQDQSDVERDAKSIRRTLKKKQTSVMHLEKQEMRYHGDKLDKLPQARD
jgi:hypothetical protein